MAGVHRSALVQCVALFLAAVLMRSAPAQAEPVRGIQPAARTPIAIRGGVLMIPLVAQQPGTNWPDALQLTTAEGRVIDGQVAWIESVEPPLVRRWTDDPRHVAVRAVRPDDDSSASARLANDGDGPLRLLDHQVQPIWKDRVAPPTVLDPELRELTLRDRPDMPDPDSPLEYWRWVLLAERMELSPPGRDHFGAPGALIAEYQAELWRLGLERLEGVNERLCDRVRHLLTSVSRDRDHAFATWVSDPGQLDALLGTLLQFDVPDQQVAREARAWLDSRAPVVMWPITLYGRTIELALVNRLERAVPAELAWEGSSAPAEKLRLPAGVLSRVQLERPQPAARGIGVPTIEQAGPQVLNVVAGRMRIGSLTFPPPSIVAKPPGVHVTAFHPPLTLADAQRFRQAPVAESRATTANVRRLGGDWEVFVECRRPQPPADRRPAVVQGATTIQDVRGAEAITLLLGWDRLRDDPAIVLTVPERGWWSLLRGRQHGSLQIHRGSYADRWYCRIVLPDEWLEYGLEPDALLLGLVRTHHGDEAMETAPNRALPWRPDPGLMRIDTGEWDDLPRYDE